jgi:CRP-like cAMP-binding protein
LTLVSVENCTGEVLIREGAACDDIFLILNGSLEVSVAAWRPAHCSTGNRRGGRRMSFVDGQPPSATVTALEPALWLAISCSQLRHKLQQDMWFASRFTGL